MSLSDSPCISDAQHSVRPDQSRCIYHVLPRQQDVFHPTGHDLLNGIPLPGTENRHQVGPHVLRHMPYLPPRRERPSRLSQQLGITSSASRRRLQTSHETLPLDASPLVSRETDSRAWCGRHGRAPTSPPRPALPGQVGTVPLLSLSGTPGKPVSSQEPHPCLSTAPPCRTPPSTPRLVHQPMHYRGRRRHKQSSLLESEPTPPPGKGLRCHDRHLIGYVRAARQLEDPRRELSSIISRPVSRETGDPE